MVKTNLVSLCELVIYLATQSWKKYEDWDRAASDKGSITVFCSLAVCVYFVYLSVIVYPLRTLNNVTARAHIFVPLMVNIM